MMHMLYLHCVHAGSWCNLVLYEPTSSSVALLFASFSNICLDLEGIEKTLNREGVLQSYEP